MFRMIFSSIIRSSRLYTYSNRHLSNRYCCLLAGKQTAVSVAVCTILTPDDGQKDRPKHVEHHSKIK